MLDGLGDLTALITAVGVLAGAIGVAAVKISACIDELRHQTLKVQQQTVRARIAADDTGQAVESNTTQIKNDVSDISVKVERLHFLLTERVAISDRQFSRMDDRLQVLESREK